MNHCVRYSVDPNLIGLVPVEQLEKHNVCVFDPFKKQAKIYRPSAISPPSSFKGAPIPVPDERPEIEVSSSDYHKIISRKTVEIDEETKIHVHKKVKIINKTTGSFVIRTLKLVGNKGYFI